MRKPRPGDVFAKAMYGREPQECYLAKLCVCCGKYVGALKDELSKKEYEISVMCQECQNNTFV